MVAETRYFNTRNFAGLNEGHCPINLDFVSINDDFFQIRHNAPFRIPLQQPQRMGAALDRVLTDGRA